MSISESVDRALEQSKELQQSISDALDKAVDQLKPQVESSLRIARDLQVTLVKHMDAETEMVIKNSSDALSHLDDYLALGLQALQDTSEQARSIAKKMLQQSMKVVDATAAAAGAVKEAPAAKQTPTAKQPAPPERADAPEQSPSEPPPEEA